MPLQINLPDETVRDFNEEAKNELKNVLVHYANRIIIEANKFETNNRKTPGPPEIKRSHIKNSAIVVDRNYFIPPRPRWLYVIKVIAMIGTVIVGYLFTKLTEPWGPIVFAVVLVITTILLTIQYKNE
jgi:hypothetical protein